jgi:hypothetical protein
VKSRQTQNIATQSDRDIKYPLNKLPSLSSTSANATLSSSVEIQAKQN